MAFLFHQVRLNKILNSKNSFTEFDSNGDLHETKEVIDKEALAGGLLLIYRCIRVPSGGYEHDFLTTLMTRAKIVFPRSPYLNLATARNNYQSWDQDSGFRTIVGAVDMFLVKFPNHSLSKFRMGTIPSRWRDCSALKGIYEIIERYTLEKLSVFLSWCWEDALFPEIESLWAKDISAHSQPDGYFPYMSDFGFVNRSPYSTTANPALHLFVSTLFACLVDKRGFNSLIQ
ncbi:hypothetical protein RUM44_006537 [Polyplax serrata]|uniref:Rhabdovirus nucleocapsid domain-containing protein n=1 Tax=Polyplax serrata TaxID=468196 RepID=A0ABR1AIK6_POLSC